MRKKLKSDRGASLILALLFFVMCAVIGSIVLTAATVAAGRVKDLQETAQEEYDLYSAAEYLQDVLTGKGYVERSSLPTEIKDEPAQILGALTKAYIQSPTSYLEDRINKKVDDAYDLHHDSVIDVPVLTRAVEESKDFFDPLYKASLFYPATERIKVPDIEIYTVIKCTGPEVTGNEVVAHFEIYNNLDVRIELYEKQDLKEKTEIKPGSRKLYLWLYASDIAVTAAYYTSDYSQEKRAGTMKSRSPFTVRWLNSAISVSPMDEVTT